MLVPAKQQIARSVKLETVSFALPGNISRSKGLKRTLVSRAALVATAEISHLFTGHMTRQDLISDAAHVKKMVVWIALVTIEFATVDAPPLGSYSLTLIKPSTKAIKKLSEAVCLQQIES